MSNPFFTLQDRLVVLLRAHSYFAGLPEAGLLTEKIGDLETKVATDLLPLGFGVVVTTAKGDAQSSLSASKSRETLTVSLIHNPLLEPNKNVLDALHAAFLAVNGQPVIANWPVRSEDDCWRFTGHERRLDAPEGLHVHQVFFSAVLKL